MINKSLIVLNEKHDKYLKPQRNFSHNDKDQYIDGINKQFNKMKEYLPCKCSKILSIGCGLGIPELTFYEFYDKNEIDFFLFDKTLIDKNIHFGYKNTASFYNNLNITKELYLEYGINEQNIHLINAENDNLLGLPKMDIIVSFIAWGFHFPLSTYLENVIKLMHKDTILIIDIRFTEDNKSEKLINKYFKVLNENDTSGKKSYRYVLKLLD